MGRPKALVDDWLVRSVSALDSGGCARVAVVLGASADSASSLLEGHDVDVVVAPDWAEGMGASLRAGLSALPPSWEAALVSLVDLPDVGASVVARVLDTVAAGGTRAALARASYDGTPGHPVLLGRDHWPGVLRGAEGDRGARDYLATHPAVLVECGDLAGGRDVDR
jgi:CTP:molybdopterin cytidylyltransferase MocA